MPLRGLTPVALQVRPDLHIAEGRMFTPGTSEIVVGRAASRQFSNLTVGSTVKSGKMTWQVVGIFEAAAASPSRSCGATPRCCKASISAETPTSRSISGWRRIESLQRLKDALTTDPRLNVTVVREPDYYAQQSQVMQTIIRTIGIGIAVLMGLGAVFGAVNTMYSAVAARTREIATLRALGFGSTPVVVSVLVEAVLLSLIGGAVGGLVAWAGFDGYQTATMNWQSFSQVAFAFGVTPRLLGWGLLAATAMGLLGGLLPPSAPHASLSFPPSVNCKTLFGPAR